MYFHPSEQGWRVKLRSRLQIVLAAVAGPVFVPARGTFATYVAKWVSLQMGPGHNHLRKRETIPVCVEFYVSRPSLPTAP